MVKVRIAILCENTSTEITVLAKNMDAIRKNIGDALSDTACKFLCFQDIMNAVSFFSVDSIESISLTEVIPFEIIEEKEKRRR